MQDASVDDIFNSEFRHEQVMKFVTGILDSSMKMPPLPEDDPDYRKEMAQEYAQLAHNIISYTSGKIRGEELAKVEQDIYKIFVLMKVTDSIEEKVSRDKILQEFELIHKRLDSNNMLMLELVKVLGSKDKDDK